MDSIEVYLQIWKELKPHLMGGDLESAAEDFVRVLIENGVNAEDVTEFAIDKEIKLALAEYIDLEDEEFEDEDEEYHE